MVNRLVRGTSALALSAVGIIGGCSGEAPHEAKTAQTAPVTRPSYSPHRLDAVDEKLLSDLPNAQADFERKVASGSFSASVAMQACVVIQQPGTNIIDVLTNPYTLNVTGDAQHTLHMAAGYSELEHRFVYGNPVSVTAKPDGSSELHELSDTVDEFSLVTNGSVFTTVNTKRVQAASGGTYVIDTATNLAIGSVVSFRNIGGGDIDSFMQTDAVAQLCELGTVPIQVAQTDSQAA